MLEKDAGTDAGSEMDAGADASDGDAGTAPDAGPVTRYALAFDGDGDEVEFPMSFGDVGQRFTYEMWVRPTSSDAGSDEGEGGMLFVHRAHCRDVVLEWSGSVDTRIPQRFRFWVYGGSGSCGWVVAQSGSTSTVGDWHHVAGVFEDGAMRLYVDGVLAASATQPTAPSWTANLLGHWAGRDGADSRPTRGGFIGEIDELRVSSTARYAGSSITPPVHLTTDESTLGLWLFDEGSGIVISDASSTGLDGTIRNATWVLSSR